ncbi:hypothetical protein RJ639_014715 [Escallonia herrerae]|uniref:Uncharacterized protein n=1 Tax=Escallonia herrerae TaxID=1293975 RepID=A0AA89AQE1_9ASTE|nr:hypothetical protein RJ639_014715 [Escallonia herrerae]
MTDYRYVPGENPIFLKEKMSKIEKDVVVRLMVIGTKYMEAEREFQAMHLSLYRAAMEGKVDIILHDRTKLEHQLTPNKNTVLHIASMLVTQNARMKF